MTTRNTIIYYGFIFHGYDDYLLACSSAASSCDTERRMILAVAAERMQDGSIYGYTFEDHAMRMYMTQRNDVLAYMKNVGWKKDWICHQL